MRVFFKAWPYLYAELRHFLLLLVLTLGLIGFGTATAFLSFDIFWDSVGRSAPLGSGQAALLLLPEEDYVNVTQLSDQSRETLLFRFLLLSAVIIVISTTADVGLRTYKAWLLQRVNQRLRTQMVANAENLSVRFHGDAKTGDLVYRVFQDSAMVTAVVDNVIVIPILSLTTLSMQVVIASLFSPWIALLLMLGIGTCIAVLVPMTIRLRRRSAGARTASAALFTRVQETLASIQAIKGYAHEGVNTNQFETESGHAIDTAFDLRREFAIIKAVTGYALVLVLFSADYLATQYVLREDPVFGASILVFFGLSLTTWTVAAHQARRGSMEAVNGTTNELIRVWCLAQDMLIGLGRAFWLLEVKPEVEDAENPVSFPALEDGIELRDVAFAYGPGKPVLKGVNLKVRKGEVVALVGPSGSGKSTLMSLLLRLFDPDDGVIEIDGVDLRQIRLDELRANMAIALQENVLFPISIADNLRYANPDVSDADIERACQAACVDFIDTLPQGMDTVLGVGGALLSTGQKQRLSIARALLRDTRILILDEPTASLDTVTEHKVLENLKHWGQDRIVFLITHRDSTLRNADRVLRLEAGHLSEVATGA